MAAKVLSFTKPKTYWALKQLGTDNYIKHTGHYSLSIGVNEGSVWNSEARANDWAYSAGKAYGGTWAAVRVIVTATVMPYTVDAVKLAEPVVDLTGME